MRGVFNVEMSGLLPNNGPLSTIPEKSTQNSSGVSPDRDAVNAPAEAASDTISLIQEVRSIQQLVRSKFNELNRQLIQHCTRTQRVLHYIQLRIDEFLRPQRSSIRRRTSTRSSRLPNQRPQYHLRSVAQRASTLRTYRRVSHRISPQRSMAWRIAGQMPSVIHRRSVLSRPPQTRNNAELSGNGNSSEILRSTTNYPRDSISFE